MTLTEKKRKKRKYCDSITYTTGDMQFNIDTFNKINGTLGLGTGLETNSEGNGDTFGEGSGGLTEAMSFTTIKKLLDEIWANRQGTEGVLAQIDTSGGSGTYIAKWAETKVANLVHLSGKEELDLDQPVPDENGVQSGESVDSLNEILKKPKTIVLITDFLAADASSRNQFLKLFLRKNIQLIIITGTALELHRMPENIKAKFTHNISFLEKDNKGDKLQAATADNKVYDYAGDEPMNTTESLTEAKREVRRYYIRPQNIFCANKAEIIKALIDIGDQNCSVYTLKYLGPEKDINKLTVKDIIYYYDNEILYDKNHVKVMDYDLYIKHEEERKKFTTDVEDIPEEKFNDEYEDRIHQNTVLEDIDVLNQDFDDIDMLGESKDKHFTCCICGEESEGYGNNPDPYKKTGRCCANCNLKFVIPARLTQYQDEYSWPGLDDYFDEVDEE